MTITRPMRAILSTVGILVAALAYGTLVWQPIAAARAAAATALTRAKADAAPAPTGDPARAITAAAARARLTIRSIAPRGEGTRVVVEDAPFDRALDWLARLDRDAGLRASRVAIARRPQPGRVSVDVTLERG